MKAVLLYFGSFNPVHKGHIAVAEWVLAQGVCNELWFVVSPQNPLKTDGSLIGETDRLAMVELAIDVSKYPHRMKTCDVEFSMPRPSYTIDTLRELSVRYPDVEFSILVGSDIVGQIEYWKEWRALLENYKVYVYPRRGYEMPDKDDKRFIQLLGAPLEDYSSTEVRQALEENGNSDMIPDVVKKYIKNTGLWKTVMK